MHKNAEILNHSLINMNIELQSSANNEKNQILKKSFESDKAMKDINYNSDKSQDFLCIS